MRYLGYKIPVPPKRDLKAWQKLHEQLNNEQFRCADQTYASAVRIRHNIERQIKELESRPDNPGRNKAIRLLKKQLE